MTRQKDRKLLGIRKFDSITTAAVIEMLVNVLISLSDTAITGHIIGEKGLSAMNVIAPVTGFTVFTEALFAVGTAMIYARHVGNYEQEKADKTFGMGLILASVVGLLTFLAVKLILPPYLDFMGIHGRVRNYIFGYMGFLAVELMISPVYELVCQLVYTDGDEYVGMGSNILNPSLNIVLSIVLGQRFGMRGIGLGSLLSKIAAAAFLGIHFAKKNNTLHPRWSFSGSELREMLVFGWNESSMFFLLPISFLVITKFVILRFGDFYLPVLSVMYAILELTAIFESTGEAMRPILPIYVKDQNLTAFMRLARHSLQVNLMQGILFGALLSITAPWIPMAFDISDSILFALCVFGLRIYGLACPAMSLLALANSFYLNSGKPMLAVRESILNQLVCPVAAVLAFGLLFGTRGLFIGFAAVPFLTCILFFGYVLRRLGKKGFPWYTQMDAAPALDRDIVLNPEEIMDFVQEAGEFMKEKGPGGAAGHWVEMLFEELLMLIREKNEGETVEAECYIRIDGTAAFCSIWDTGVVFDIMDENMKIADFRSFVVSSVVSQLGQKKHGIATSFNRSAFRVDAEELLPVPGH
ncbi:MAG: hypothetical protein J5947_08515 [Clostridium sp.]|nr:hypothetical protein [Clostridium sp.]MBO6150223.1 hypothetical protein [Clostridium sp.]